MLKLPKTLLGLRSTTAGRDAIRSADTPPTLAMLDRCAERHFMRLLTQKNSNSDLIPDEPDGLVDGEDIQILDSWTERTAEDLWILREEVELSFPGCLDYTPWHEEELIDFHRNRIDECITNGLMVHVEYLQLLGGHFGGTMTRENK
jgi:hypothetical protein